jgi:hypothetical protein
VHVSLTGHFKAFSELENRRSTNNRNNRNDGEEKIHKTDGSHCGMNDEGIGNGMVTVQTGHFGCWVENLLWIGQVNSFIVLYNDDASQHGYDHQWPAGKAGTGFCTLRNCCRLR